MLGLRVLFIAAVAETAQYATRDLAVVEWNRTILKNLIGLVAFTGEDYNISGRGVFYGFSDGSLTVGLRRVRRIVAPQADHCVVHDGERIFAARIIGGENHVVAEFSRRHSHQRPLGAIAIAATA